jgi:hypothetical protein
MTRSSPREGVKRGFSALMRSPLMTRASPREGVKREPGWMGVGRLCQTPVAAPPPASLAGGTPALHVRDEGGEFADGGGKFLNGGGNFSKLPAPFSKGAVPFADGGAPIRELPAPIAGGDTPIFILPAPLRKISAPIRKGGAPIAKHSAGFSPLPLDSAGRNALSAPFRPLSPGFLQPGGADSDFSS